MKFVLHNGILFVYKFVEADLMRFTLIGYKVYFEKKGNQIESLLLH